jgi:hypothetical protein
MRFHVPANQLRWEFDSPLKPVPIVMNAGLQINNREERIDRSEDLYITDMNNTANKAYFPSD